MHYLSSNTYKIHRSDTEQVKHTNTNQKEINLYLQPKLKLDSVIASEVE